MNTIEIDQSAGNVDALFEPGDTVLFGLEIVSVDDAGVETPLDLSPFAMSAIAVLSNRAEVAGVVTVTDAANGSLTVDFGELAATADWRLQWVSAAGVHQTVVKGVIQIGDTDCGC